MTISSINHLEAASYKTNQPPTPKAIARLVQNIAKKTEQIPIIPGTNHLRFDQSGSYRFFCVHKEEQKSLNMEEAKVAIFQQLDLPQNTQVVQVIGDSAKFSPAGTSTATQFLAEQLNHPNRLILWGFTGHGGKNESELCTNQIVNNWIDQDDDRFKRSLANLVDYHTPTALTDWGCNISQTNRNFYLTYGDARFGDDIASSDPMTDIGICLEGGVQSFTQIVNFLAHEKPVYGIYHIRGDSNPACFSIQENAYLNFFSAGEFIEFIKAAISKSKEDISAAQLNQVKDDYLSTRYLFNPDRKDADTKQALFDSGWKLFLNEKFWKKLHLCTFLDGSTL